MIYLILSIIFSTSLVLIFKLFDRFNINNFQAIVFNYITAAFICYLTLTEPININSITSEGWLPYSIMIGLMFISLFNLIAYSVQNVGISVTSVANKISLCIPVIFAFIYYGDSVSLIKVIGITLALFAVYFTSKNNEKKASFNSILFIVPIVLFVGSGLLDVIFIHSLETFDLVNKGFGKAPKFPQPILHEFILEHYSKTKDKDFLKISLETLDAIEKGGIHDQVGGGFHRYSVDEKWLVPHFEKMLYDNTSLAYLYLNAYRITKKEKYKNTVEKTLNYLSKEMLSESGGFYSAQDADSEGVEGKFFTWSINEINSVLNKEEVKSIISNFNLTHEGNFEGKNIFYKNEDIKEKDKKVISEALKKLYKERSKRIPPLTDRKVITSWNSMALKVFAKAGVIFGNKKWIEIAEKNANYLLKNNILNNKIQRASYENAPSNIHGQLEDYSYLIQALIELNESTGENKWIEKAISFTDKMIDEFWSEKEGKFYDSGKSSTDTLVRPSTTQDNITASGISVACEILIKLGVITNDNNYIEIVEKQLKNASNDIGRYPAAHCNWLKFLNIDNYSSQIVFTGKNFMSLLKTVNSEFLPSLTYGFDKGEKSFYISKDKYLDGKNLAYFCKDYHCELPVESDEELLNQIRN